MKISCMGEWFFLRSSENDFFRSPGPLGKINVSGPETAGSGGGLPLEGLWWSKSSCPLSKVCLPWVSKRGTWDVLGILLGCPGPLGVFKKFVQKMFVLIFPPLQLSGHFLVTLWQWLVDCPLPFGTRIKYLTLTPDELL